MGRAGEVRVEGALGNTARAKPGRLWWLLEGHGGRREVWEYVEYRFSEVTDENT